MACKKFSLHLFLAIPFFANAQKGIDGLINAEKSFAAYSVAQGTKHAFLKFADSTAVVFENGKAVNAIETWNKRENRPAILNWRPQYAAISKSGDLGFTMGPWTFQQTLHDTIVARGHYTTVWHLTNNGEWKFLADLGAGNSPVNGDTALVILKAKGKIKSGSLSNMLAAERNFIGLKDRKQAYDKFLSTTAVLNRNGKLPQYASWDAPSLPALTEYIVIGSGIASSGDFGYVYGTTVINGKTDNYLRIWWQENGKWKIGAEVLRY